jgi:N-acetylmuramoyl-L-alanine amidase
MMRGRSVIAIDAGHGGEDPGALGHRGTREKDVALASRVHSHRLVANDPDLQPVLIRNGDYIVSLRRRIEIARENRADLFVSIHADAFKDASAHGASVYALSERGATNEAARWLAERENAADLIGGVSLDDKDDLLASVLLDLSQTATLSASLQAGAHVLSELQEIGAVRRRDVQQAGFLVLKSPDIPSILVETAYISNRRTSAAARPARAGASRGVDPHGAASVLAGESPCRHAPREACG